jgi:hypothetical protein
MPLPRTELTLAQTSTGWLVLVDGVTTADEFPKLGAAVREFAARRDEFLATRHEHEVRYRKLLGYECDLEIPTSCGYECDCDDALAHALLVYDATVEMASVRTAEANLQETLAMWWD